VIRDTTPLQDGMNRTIVEGEKNGTKYGTLGYTKKKKNGSRAYTRNANTLEATSQVRFKPGEDSARKAEKSTQTTQQNTMIHSVKCCTLVKQGQHSSIAIIQH
jgi:hypothetical protein